MDNYWSEFLPLMLVAMLAVISPGPDFVLILRQALMKGRRAALLSSLGIGMAMLVHVGYTISGLGLIIAQSLFLFHIVKGLSVAYLLYLGFRALASRPNTDNLSSPQASPQNDQSLAKAFMTGFTINLLNPKAVVFFLAIFSSLVAPTTPIEIKFTYGLSIATLTMAWFIVVSLVITLPSIRAMFLRLSKWINRATGLIFIGLGIKLIFYQSSPPVS